MNFHILSFFFFQIEHLVRNKRSTILSNEFSEGDNEFVVYTVPNAFILCSVDAYSQVVIILFSARKKSKAIQNFLFMQNVEHAWSNEFFTLSTLRM